MILRILFLLTSTSFSTEGRIVFDSTGVRRPRIHLPALARQWTPDAFAKAETSNKRQSRKLLAEYSAPFKGRWEDDFAVFKKRWSKAVADGTWQLLVTGFWRAINGLNEDFGDSPTKEQWVRMMDEWDAWMETTDPRLRATLGEMTGREFCKGASSFGRPVVAPGSEFALDFSRARVEGPVTARVQRYVRKGLSFDRLVPAKGPAPWTPGTSPYWSIRLADPGLYRIVLRSKAWYQQVLLEVSDVRTMTVATDSGALVWAPGGAKRKWLLWKTASGKVDSAPIGEAPLHLGFSEQADSALVGVASGQDLSVLRMRLPRLGQAAIVFGSRDLDWHGRPVSSAPRPETMAFAWAASIVATPDAVESGAVARASGVVRRMDPYGRPDSARADSLELEIDTGNGSIRRRVPVSPEGLWTDSVVLHSDGGFSLERLWSGGRVVAENLCRMAHVRVRNGASGTLAGRREQERDGTPGAVRHRLQPDSARLLILATGKALDWKYPASPGDTAYEVPMQPTAAGGWSLERIDVAGSGWTHDRVDVLFDPPKGEGWMGLTVGAQPDSVAAGSPLDLVIVPRHGKTAPAAVFVALMDDSLAGTLDGMGDLLGKAWARSELSFPDQALSAVGINNMGSMIASYDEDADLDRFVRLGLRVFPGPCVRCHPWTGSYSDGSLANYRPQQQCSIGYTFGPGTKAPAPLSAPSIWEGPVAVGPDGVVPGSLHWPSRPGRHRLQVWGIDMSGRLLAWEKSVVVR